MRAGEEVNIGREWQSTVEDTPAFVLKLVVIARSFPRGPSPLAPVWAIPLYTPGSPGHPGHPPPTAPHSTDLPSPSTTVSFFPFLY
jgi:hypothetical protein